MKKNLISSIKEIIEQNNLNNINVENLLNIMIYDIYKNSNYFQGMNNYLELISDDNKVILSNASFNSIEGLRNGEFKKLYYCNGILANENINLIFPSDNKLTYYYDEEKVKKLDNLKKYLIDSKKFEDLYQYIYNEGKYFLNDLPDIILNNKNYDKNIIKILIRTFPFTGFEEDNLENILYYNSYKSFKIDSLDIRDIFYYELNHYLKLNNEEIKLRFIQDKDLKLLSNNYKRILNKKDLDFENNGEKIYKNIINNPYIYKSSILKSLLEHNNKEDRAIDLYNRFYFDKAKNNLLKNLEDHNYKKIENIYNKYDEEIKKYRELIYKKFPILNNTNLGFNVDYEYSSNKIGKIIDNKSHFLNIFESIDYYNCKKGLKNLEYEYATLKTNYKKVLFYAYNKLEIIGEMTTTESDNNYFLNIYNFHISKNIINNEEVLEKMSKKILDYAEENNLIIKYDFIRMNQEKAYLYDKIMNNIIKQKNNNVLILKNFNQNEYADRYSKQFNRDLYKIFEEENNNLLRKAIIDFNKLIKKIEILEENETNNEIAKDLYNNFIEILKKNNLKKNISYKRLN